MDSLDDQLYSYLDTISIDMDFLGDQLAYLDQQRCQDQIIMEQW